MTRNAHSCLKPAEPAGSPQPALATEGGASWPPHREYRQGRRRDSALTSFWSESPNLTYGEKEGGIGKEERKTAHSTLHFILLFGRGNSSLYLLKGVQATSLTFGRSAGRHYNVGSFSGLLLRECRWRIQRGRLAGSIILTFPTKPQPSCNHPLARGMREQLVTTGIRGRTSCACSYGGVAGLCSAANRFVLFTERRTGFS